ncbi:MAG: HD domain-containing protein [Candidatus Hydrogenedentes bacterium]|nr:HD domain-containing protein [Candidatus Hydrogenedentota bacterium]
MLYSPRVVDAFALAFELHGAQCRKGSPVPYITHPMAVAATVGQYGGDEDQVIAALLHDAAEDAGGRDTLSRVRTAFGERVAHYVEACSDTMVTPKPPWRDRKERFLEGLRAACGGVKLIVAADKLHNAETTLSDLMETGPSVWERFTGGRDGTLWYYRETREALRAGWAHPILRPLGRAVDAVEEMARETG